VHTATAEGRHDRAYALGRALGELETQPLAAGPVASSSLPAVLAPAVREDTARIADAPAVAPQARKSLMQTAPYRIPPDEVTHLLEPDSRLLAECQASEGARPSPAPLAAPWRERPRPPDAPADSLDLTLTNVRPPAPAPPSARRDAVEHTVVMNADEMPAPSRAEPSGPPTTLGSSHAVLEPMRALRVSVESGAGRQLVLRLLDGDEPLPEGAQEALLVPLPVTDEPARGHRRS
jgi:hypothetical protein